MIHEFNPQPKPFVVKKQKTNESEYNPLNWTFENYKREVKGNLENYYRQFDRPGVVQFASELVSEGYQRGSSLLAEHLGGPIPDYRQQANTVFDQRLISDPEFESFRSLNAPRSFERQMQSVNDLGKGMMQLPSEWTQALRGSEGPALLFDDLRSRITEYGRNNLTYQLSPSEYRDFYSFGNGESREFISKALAEGNAEYTEPSAVRKLFLAEHEEKWGENLSQYNRDQLTQIRNEHWETRERLWGEYMQTAESKFLEQADRLDARIARIDQHVSMLPAEAVERANIESRGAQLSEIFAAEEKAPLMLSDYERVQWQRQTNPLVQDMSQAWDVFDRNVTGSARNNILLGRRYQYWTEVYNDVSRRYDNFHFNELAGDARELATSLYGEVKQYAWDRAKEMLRKAVLNNGNLVADSLYAGYMIANFVSDVVDENLESSEKDAFDKNYTWSINRTQWTKRDGLLGLKTEVLNNDNLGSWLKSLKSQYETFKKGDTRQGIAHFNDPYGILESYAGEAFAFGFEQNKYNQGTPIPGSLGMEFTKDLPLSHVFWNAGTLDPNSLTKISYENLMLLQDLGATDALLYAFQLDLDTLPILSAQEYYQKLSDGEDVRYFKLKDTLTIDLDDKKVMKGFMSGTTKINEFALEKISFISSGDESRLDKWRESLDVKRKLIEQLKSEMEKGQVDYGDLRYVPWADEVPDDQGGIVLPDVTDDQGEVGDGSDEKEVTPTEPTKDPAEIIKEFEEKLNEEETKYEEAVKDNNENKKKKFDLVQKKGDPKKGKYKNLRKPVPIPPSKPKRSLLSESDKKDTLQTYALQILGYLSYFF